MSNLEEQISDQYKRRAQSTIDYNSGYAKFADEEREVKTRELLQKYFSNYSTKRFLEIGAGQGGNLPFFHQMGFQWQNMYANELLQDRVETLRTNFPQCTILEGNALELLEDVKYDIVYQSTVFTSILKQEDRVQLAKRMWQVLNPNGIILWYDFAFNNPSNKDVRKVDKHELKLLFPQAKLSEIKKITLAPPIGRRVGALYPLLNVSLLRTHLLAIFQK
jgi:trans-aconitate methyltransferase